MKSHLINYGIVVAAIVGVSCLLLVSKPAAQNANTAAAKSAAAAAKPTPRMSDGHPDLTGFYGTGVAGVGNYGNVPTGSDEAGDLKRLPDGSFFFDYAGAEGGHPDDGDHVVQSANQPAYKPEYMAKVQA